MKLDFDPGFDITPLSVDEGFRLGADCFDKGTEFRKLDSVRKSLRGPNCDGPENVYAIMMDVGHKKDLPAMQQRMLLYGVVTYAAGQLGDEPIRSQGHIHKVSAHCGWSTPEVYEIWTGKAVIYMQESGQDDPGRCFAVEAGAGDVVIVPPGWVHATISADPKQPLTFGAWCDRDYGFAYADVRRHGGIAWFPLLTAEGKLRWTPNPAYHTSQLTIKPPRDYSDLGLERASRFTASSRKTRIGSCLCPTRRARRISGRITSRKGERAKVCSFRKTSCGEQQRPPIRLRVQ